MLKAISVVLGVVMIAAVGAHSWPAYAGKSFDRSSCTFNGKKLYGAIQEVSSGADVYVQVVSSGADLSVQKVSSGAGSCGLWQMVSSGGNTMVKFVSSGADVSIQYVTSGAGLR